MSDLWNFIVVMYLVTGVLLLAILSNYAHGRQLGFRIAGIIAVVTAWPVMLVAAAVMHLIDGKAKPARRADDAEDDDWGEM